MTLTAGVISLVSKSSTTAALSATAATGGTSPYTYQWYRSTTSGFSPGGGNILSGKTALTLSDSGLVPGTQYYYKVVVTDVGNSNVTAEYAQLGVATTQQVQSQNAFSQGVQLGMVDLAYSYNTKAMQIDVSESGTLYAGQAVKIYDRAGGLPKVVACSADSDEVMGFINYNIKNPSFVAGSVVEVSQAGNVMYLYATGAIARGVQVSLDLVTVGGVRSAAGNTGDDIVGYALDKATAAGDLIRVNLSVPSFLKV